MQRTSLYDHHLTAKAKMVDFAGWEMPIHYGSQLNEHKQVRSHAGMFDVSHMVVTDITGSDSKAFLQKLLANDVGRLQQEGKALYSCMLNETGGVIDDLIVYYMRADYYRLVTNAATREKDLAWLEQNADGFNVTITERDGFSMLAIQGPQARDLTIKELPQAEQAAAEALAPFSGHEFSNGQGFIARTGYTGEDGFELLLPHSEIGVFWDALLARGVKPIGLGARDTLRLEAGMNLYGQDMDEQSSPLVSGLSWTIAWEPETRDFIGRSALEKQRAAGVQQRFVGLLLEGKGVLRSHMKVICDGGEGITTSGTFSPTLGGAIALARIPKDGSSQCEIEMRGKLVPARIVKPAFVRYGKAL